MRALTNSFKFGDFMDDFEHGMKSFVMYSCFDYTLTLDIESPVFTRVSDYIITLLVNQLGARRFGGH